jgi:type II secretory pathway component PulF
MTYKILYQENKRVKKILLEAHTLEELKSLSTYPQNIVSVKKLTSFTLNKNIFRNNKKDVYELFSQLDIMLGANLSFNQSIDLLLKSKQEKTIQEVLIIIKKALSSSTSLDIALISYRKYLGDTVLLFLRLGFEHGNIKESIHSLVEILSEDIDSSDKLSEVMRYPIILILSLLISISMIFVYVLPNFEFIFLLLKDDIPTATKVLLGIKNILNDYGIFLLIGTGFLVLIIISLLKKFRYFFDEVFLLKIPVLSRVIQDYYFYRLFLSISIIVTSKYQFQVAILNSKNIVNNLYVQDTMNHILTNIKNGSSISDAFEQSNIFDNLTIKLLHTADYTNEYESILSDITAQYKKRFHKSLNNFSSTIEPILIFFIAIIVLWLILAIMLPIWNLGAVIN